MKKLAKAGAYVGFAYVMYRFDDIADAGVDKLVSRLARSLPPSHDEQHM